MMHADIRGSEVPLDAEGKVYHLRVSAEKIAKQIILVGDPARSRLVSSNFDLDPVPFRAENREFITYTGKYHGVPVSVISTGIGTDNTEIALVELHVLNEYDSRSGSWKRDHEPLTIIRVGTCGSPQPDVKLGSLAITSYAIGLDNTGIYYPPPKGDEVSKRLVDQVNRTKLKRIGPYVSRAHPTVVKALADAAEGLSLEFYVGITSSASGFYAPQGRQVGRLSDILVPDLQTVLAGLCVKHGGKEIRVISNEMESSLLNRLCEVLGYESGSICAIHAKRKTGGFAGEFLDSAGCERSIDNCIQVALDAMVRLRKTGITRNST
jgi:uridine phosphorylase